MLEWSIHPRHPDVKDHGALVQWQSETALKGSEKRAYPKKLINWTTVRKQLAAGIGLIIS